MIERRVDRLFSAQIIQIYLPARTELCSGKGLDFVEDHRGGTLNGDLQPCPQLWSRFVSGVVLLVVHPGIETHGQRCVLQLC
ncbi:MAG: hypothetical protein OXM62_06005 [bacterium]|nr:hypothetical protein [bacterium]MDE0234542.1 hypothetical protein [bacterium]